MLRHVPDEYEDPLSSQVIPDSEGYTKTLRIEWNAKSDRFRLTVSDIPNLKEVTKRFLVSDIACGENSPKFLMYSAGFHVMLSR